MSYHTYMHTVYSECHVFVARLARLARWLNDDKIILAAVRTTVQVTMMIVVITILQLMIYIYIYI